MKNVKNITIILVSLIFIIQCQNPRENQKSGNLVDVAHPTAENIPGDDVAAAVLSPSDEPMPEGFVIKGFSENMEELFSLGALDTAREELFNRIEDIAIDSKGRIYILDTRRYGVGVFDLEGDYITTLGQQGQGPGEFENPQSLALYRDSLLFVSNLTRAEIFNIAEEPKYEATLGFDSPSNSICIIGDTLFAHSPRFINTEDPENSNEMNTIDAYSANSHEYLYSFGESYQSSHPEVALRMSEGAISCNEASSTVVFRFQNMPVLQGYDATSGTLKWISRIDGLSMSSITESYQSGQLRFSYGRSDGEWTDFIWEPVNIQGEYQILQVQRGYHDLESPTEYVSFGLNSATGEGVFIGHQLPYISGFSNGILASRDLSQDYPIARIYSVATE